MKHFFFVLLCAAVMASCTKPSSGGTGTLSLSVRTQEEVSDAVKSNLTDYVEALPGKDDFTLTVSTSTGQQAWSGLLSEWPKDLRLLVGTYNLSATCGSDEEEGFAKPRYAAASEIEIAKDDTTRVVMTASLANCMVKVVRTDAFKAFFPQSDLSLTTGNGTVIPMPATETRPAFVEAWKFTLAGSLVTPGGTSYDFSRSFESGLNPATFYTLQLDVETAGTVSVLITFDNTVETVSLEEDLYE